MSELVVNCPKCTKGLKLRDRSKIGKKARCPKCSHVFVLTAPPEPDQGEDEVELKLASDVTPQPAPQPDAPAVGVAARWVPDNAPPLQQPTQPAPQQAAPQQPVNQQQVPQQTAPQQPAAGAFFEAPAAGPVVVAPEDAGGVAHLKALKKKTAKRRNTAIIAGILTAAAVGGVAYMAQDHLEAAKLAEDEEAKPKVDEDLKAEKEQLRQNTAIAKASSPTTGGPIPMNCLPLGARVIISVRPAELWKAASRGEEIRYCLGEVFGDWATSTLTELCQFEPAQIEHALIGIIPGEVGEPPTIAAVIRLVEAAKKSELLIKFGGERNQDHGYPIYVRDDLSFLIGSDLKMIAVAPSGVAAEEMATAVQYANPQSDGIDALLPQTDAERHLTLIFEPRSVVRHRDTIFPEKVWQLIDRSMEFFNDEEVETVAWSMHFGDKKFHSELLMRNQTIIMEHLLQTEMRKKLKQLPFDLVSMVERMNPGVIGPRKVIGRFPAMAQVFAMSTTGGTGTRYAQLTTELPERAAPNLALGGLLAWDESTRTNFNTAVKQVKPVDTGPKLPDLIADRLKKVIEVEFIRMPFQDAVKYIADECKCDHYIDGDALKLSGYTKNMPEDYIATCSGLDAIKHLVTRPINGQPNQRCLVIQEDQKRFLLTTKPVAKEAGLKIYEFK